ncbi:hypothetical protein [Nonomuraea glycinis]|uniref:hypothetical protein n=1 Tax=Nonomuraea glycinis TaxID=2047744 RepID=UPI0033B169FF
MFLRAECMSFLDFNSGSGSWTIAGPDPLPGGAGQERDAFRAAVKRYAEVNAIPWIVFGKTDRNIEVMRPHLEAAERAGTSKVVAIGVGQEFQWMYAATAKPTSNGIPWFDYYRTERRVSCLYFYIWDGCTLPRRCRLTPPNGSGTSDWACGPPRPANT